MIGATRIWKAVMYVRLAFAVGGHLEPEILLIDEVMAAEIPRVVL